MDEFTAMIGSPVDLSSARWVEIKITNDRVYVNAQPNSSSFTRRENIARNG
jgi:hypothetical protein